VTITDGVVRYTSKGNVPPMDIVDAMCELGLISVEDWQETKRVDAIETAEILENYRRRMAERTPEQIAEQEAEMRAAFGPGETVVNIITGQRTYL